MSYVVQFRKFAPKGNLFSNLMDDTRRKYKVFTQSIPPLQEKFENKCLKAKFLFPKRITSAKIHQREQTQTRSVISYKILMYPYEKNVLSIDSCITEQDRLRTIKFSTSFLKQQPQLKSIVG